MGQRRKLTLGFSAYPKGLARACHGTSRAGMNRSTIIKSLLLRLLAIHAGIKTLRKENKFNRRARSNNNESPSADLVCALSHVYNK
jgi:hypothetical protein